MFLLDTNVVSEFRHNANSKGSPAVAKWASTQNGLTFHMSVMSLHEIELGVGLMELRDPKQGANLRDWLEAVLIPTFEGRILPVDFEVVRVASAFNVPSPRPLADTLIGSTALIHGLTLVTRNTKDFALPGLHVLNPWETHLP